jgi:hypothetical protein
MPSLGTRHLHAISVLDWESCRTKPFTPAETIRRREGSLFDKTACSVSSKFHYAIVTYLDDGIRQVYRTERVTVVVPDQEMIGTETVLQLEPIPMKSATLAIQRVDIHNQSDLLVADINI